MWAPCHANCAVCWLWALTTSTPVEPVGESPLFCLDGKPVSRTPHIELVRAAATAIGKDAARVHGHSFRIGWASSAAAANVPEYLIQAGGRWVSDCYKIYIQTPTVILASLASMVGTMSVMHGTPAFEMFPVRR